MSSELVQKQNLPKGELCSRGQQTCVGMDYLLDTVLSSPVKLPNRMNSDTNLGRDLDLRRMMTFTL